MEHGQLQERRLRARLQEYAVKIPARMPEYGAFKKEVVIWRIYRALRKIDEGTYGQCDACSQAIGTKRLDLLPAAILCVPCQTKAELKSRQSTFGIRNSSCLAIAGQTGASEPDQHTRTE